MTAAASLSDHRFGHRFIGQPQHQGCFAIPHEDFPSLQDAPPAAAIICTYLSVFFDRSVLDFRRAASSSADSRRTASDRCT